MPAETGDSCLRDLEKTYFMGELMKGFFNRLLRIDLGAREFSYEEIPDSVLSETLGGKGLGSHLLMTNNPLGVDALSPENRLIITVGPVTGTSFWSQSRFAVFAKSPATGGFMESYCGGSSAPRIKGCGVDAVVIEGRAPQLSYLVIDENGASFLDATAMRGKEAYETETNLLENSPPGARGMVIGPAGENQVAIACIKSDKWRSLGRGGMGAVMGVKNLKGISFAGSRKADIADPDLLKKLTTEIAGKNLRTPAALGYRKFGTPMQVEVVNGVNCFPTRYWQKGHHDKWENLSASYMQENFDVKACGCPTCFLKCTKRSRLKHGRHAGLEIEGPEFETIYAIGGLNELDSLEEVAWLNDICDRLGMDTMSAGNLSAFAIEAYKRGKTNFQIDYNQPDRIAELFRMIAFREGVGALFAKGIKQASEELGLEDIAIHVKGLEPAGFDPRVLKGMGLSYATSARGACHLRGTFYKAELSGEIDPEQIKGKAKLHIDYEDRAAIFDCMVLCRFYRDFIKWDELARLIEATAGLTWSRQQLESFANNVTQQARAYNEREGIQAAADTLPKPLLEEKTAEGASMTKEELDTMISEYNEIRSARSAKTRKRLP